MNLPAWGEKEISRFKYRAGLFVRRGMSAPDAETLADRLVERDWEKDDRRTCVECSHFRKTARQCDLCSCFMDLKTKMLEATCPAGKW